MMKLGVEHLEYRDCPSLDIVPTFAPSITSDPSAPTIEATIQRAIDNFQAAIETPVTVDITFQEMDSGLGESSWNYITVLYNANPEFPNFPMYYPALSALSASEPDNTTLSQALSTLPNTPGNPVNGSEFINIQTANAIALGLDSGMATGTISLNTSICSFTRPNTGGYDLLSVTEHEIDEVLGMGSALNGLPQGSPSPTGPVWGEDLYRYNSTGVRSFTTTFGAYAYFSINNGQTNLAQFNQNESGDMMDFVGSTPQVQDAFATAGAMPNLGVELTILDTLGYTVTLPAPAVISVTVNGANASLSGPQRSMVDNLVVVFNDPVTNPTFTLSLKAFTDNGVAGSFVGDATTTITATNPSGDGMTWGLTFSGPTVIGGSISDGDYNLNFAGQSVGSFYRLFGDVDGNGFVTNSAYNEFKETFGATPSSVANYNPAFDYYANGFITNPAYNQFKLRFGDVWTDL